MTRRTSVKLRDVVNNLKLEIVHKSSDFDEVEITSPDINRPGLQLTGFLEEFPYRRLQIIGSVEYNYLTSLDNRMQYERFRGILSYNMPAIIFSYNAGLPKDMLDLADYYDISILRSKLPTTRLTSLISQELEYVFAQRTQVHGELLEVYGVGVLILGESSVGKSETALDLVSRGHRLVADDLVEIASYDNKVVGQAPKNIRHYTEIRGLGILDIRRLYGTGSVKVYTDIDMVIELEHWREDYEYDRLGLDDHYTDLLGVQLPKILVPVRAGRNIAMIVEVAAMNQREKSMGYNAAKVMTENLFNDLED
ncbi:HPr(Ser) kinase/phosphatase [Anaerococcus sp. AGMB00486]|uniref:HPr kinase/phosphorylase n=2 Tax=Anaerococcus TaxID=165779 RepID=A0ABX2N729_9FIRM|nr:MULTISPECIES: HPr(Ser) kinase/phosphatase [Anaerococcus]MDY3007131.1 HPr(Ser) kinase/phosphatase [Anaerococcus porci]MSS77027.1 HPr(Ser) kinase/phosphatase [Anaerococcus porci]NVF10485.1 HPr(Ser) kinase/phosphatase [Anaerococcus faecalis]